MKNFCTVADRKFCDRVLALNQSLYKYGDDYILHLLCLDDEIYSSTKNTKNVIRYHINDLLKEDIFLSRSLENPPSREALINSGGNIESAKKIQFIWSLSCYFSWWCLDNLDPEDILYIDADIYFYSSYKSLYPHLKDCSIGIIEHRCDYNPDNGKYNVGIVYFKNDIDGYKCSTWWKNCLLFTNHEYYSTHNTCGEQKYLELFETLFDGVKVLDPHVGHLAPWNFLFHSYDGNKIIWKGKKQELLYCHFSNFKIDKKNHTYSLAPRHGFEVPPNKFIKDIADQYYNVLAGR